MTLGDHCHWVAELQLQAAGHCITALVLFSLLRHFCTPVACSAVCEYALLVVSNLCIYYAPWQCCFTKVVPFFYVALLSLWEQVLYIFKENRVISYFLNGILSGVMQMKGSSQTQ